MVDNSYIYNKFGVEARKKEARRMWFQDRLLNSNCSIDIDAVPLTMMSTLCEMYRVDIDLVSNIMLEQDNQLY